MESGSPVHESSKSSNGVFPPLMNTLDIYVDSTSDHRAAQVIKDVTNAQRKSKKVKKKVKKSPTHLPGTKTTGGSGYGNNNEDSFEFVSPKKSKMNVRQLAITPLDDEREAERDNFSAQENSVQTVPVFQFPQSPASAGSRPVQHSELTTPRSAPRGGRSYKIADQSIMGTHSTHIDVVFPQSTSFNKAVESIAALKLHSYAMKRRQNINQKIKLLKEIKNFEKENEHEYRKVFKTKQNELLAAWKIRFYIEYIRYLTLHDIVQTVEMKNIELEEENTKWQNRYHQEVIGQSDMKEENLVHQRTISQLENSLESQRLRFEEIINQLQLNLQQSQGVIDQQKLMMESLEMEKQAEVMKCQDQLKKNDNLCHELELTKGTCQDFIRQSLVKDNEIYELQLKIQNLDVELKASQVQLEEDSLTLQKQLYFKETELDELQNHVLQEKLSVIESLQQEISSLNDRNSILTIERNNLSDDKQRLSEEKSVLLNDKSSLQKVLSDLAKQVQVGLAEKQQLLEQIDHQQVMINHLTDKVQDYEQTCADNQAKLSEQGDSINNWMSNVFGLLPKYEESMMQNEEWYEKYRLLEQVYIRNLEYTHMVEEELFFARRGVAGGNQPIPSAFASMTSPMQGNGPVPVNGVFASPGTPPGFFPNGSVSNPSKLSATSGQVEPSLIPTQGSVATIGREMKLREIESKILDSANQAMQAPILQAAARLSSPIQNIVSVSSGLNGSIIEIQKTDEKGNNSHLLDVASQEIQKILSSSVAKAHSKGITAPANSIVDDDLDENAVLAMSDSSIMQLLSRNESLASPISTPSTNNRKSMGNALPLDQINRETLIKAMLQRIARKGNGEESRENERLVEMVNVLNEKLKLMDKASENLANVLANVNEVEIQRQQQQNQTRYLPTSSHHSDGGGSVILPGGKLEDESVELAPIEGELEDGSTFSVPLFTKSTTGLPRKILDNSEKAFYIKEYINLESLYDNISNALTMVNEELSKQQNQSTFLQESKVQCKLTMIKLQRAISAVRGIELSLADLKYDDEMSIHFQEMKYIKQQLTIARYINVKLSTKAITVQEELHNIESELVQATQEFQKQFNESILLYLPSKLVEKIESRRRQAESGNAPKALIQQLPMQSSMDTISFMDNLESTLAGTGDSVVNGPSIPSSPDRSPSPPQRKIHLTELKPNADQLSTRHTIPAPVVLSSIPVSRSNLSNAKKVAPVSAELTTGSVEIVGTDNSTIFQASQVSVGYHGSIESIVSKPEESDYDSVASPSRNSKKSKSSKSRRSRNKDGPNDERSKSGKDKTKSVREKEDDQSDENKFLNEKEKEEERTSRSNDRERSEKRKEKDRSKSRSKSRGHEIQTEDIELEKERQYRDSHEDDNAKTERHSSRSKSRKENSHDEDREKSSHRSSRSRKETSPSPDKDSVSKRYRSSDSKKEKVPTDRSVDSKREKYDNSDRKEKVSGSKKHSTSRHKKRSSESRRSKTNSIADEESDAGSTIMTGLDASLSLDDMNSLISERGLDIDNVVFPADSPVVEIMSHHTIGTPVNISVSPAFEEEVEQQPMFTSELQTIIEEKTPPKNSLLKGGLDASQSMDASTSTTLPLLPADESQVVVEEKTPPKQSVLKADLEASQSMDASTSMTLPVSPLEESQIIAKEEMGIQTSLGEEQFPTSVSTGVGQSASDPKLTPPKASLSPSVLPEKPADINDQVTTPILSIAQLDNSPSLAKTMPFNPIPPYLQLQTNNPIADLMSLTAPMIVAAASPNLFSPNGSAFSAGGSVGSKIVNKKAAPKGLQSAAFQHRNEILQRRTVIRHQQQSLREKVTAQVAVVDKYWNQLIDAQEAIAILSMTSQETKQDLQNWFQEFYELCDYYPDIADQKKSKFCRELLSAFADTQLQTLSAYQTAVKCNSEYESAVEVLIAYEKEYAEIVNASIGSGASSYKEINYRDKYPVIDVPTFVPEDATQLGTLWAMEQERIQSGSQEMPDYNELDMMDSLFLQSNASAFGMSTGIASPQESLYNIDPRSVDNNYLGGTERSYDMNLAAIYSMAPEIPKNIHSSFDEVTSQKELSFENSDSPTNLDQDIIPVYPAEEQVVNKLVVETNAEESNGKSKFSPGTIKAGARKESHSFVANLLFKATTPSPVVIPDRENNSVPSSDVDVAMPLSSGIAMSSLGGIAEFAPIVVSPIANQIVATIPSHADMPQVNTVSPTTDVSAVNNEIACSATVVVTPVKNPTPEKSPTVEEASTQPKPNNFSTIVMSNADGDLMPILRRNAEEDGQDEEKSDVAGSLLTKAENVETSTALDPTVEEGDHELFAIPLTPERSRTPEVQSSGIDVTQESPEVKPEIENLLSVPTIAPNTMEVKDETVPERPSGPSPVNLGESKDDEVVDEPIEEPEHKADEPKVVVTAPQLHPQPQPSPPQLLVQEEEEEEEDEPDRAFIIVASRVGSSQGSRSRPGTAPSRPGTAPSRPGTASRPSSSKQHGRSISPPASTFAQITEFARSLSPIAASPATRSGGGARSFSPTHIVSPTANNNASGVITPTTNRTTSMTPTIQPSTVPVPVVAPPAPAGFVIIPSRPSSAAEEGENISPVVMPQYQPQPPPPTQLSGRPIGSVGSSSSRGSTGRASSNPNPSPTHRSTGASFRQPAPEQQQQPGVVPAQPPTPQRAASPLSNIISAVMRPFTPNSAVSSVTQSVSFAPGTSFGGGGSTAESLHVTDPAELARLTEEYFALKKELKQWKSQFAQLYQRVPTMQDFHALPPEMKVKIARKNQLKRLVEGKR